MDFTLTGASWVEFGKKCSKSSRETNETGKKKIEFIELLKKKFVNLVPDTFNFLIEAQNLVFSPVAPKEKLRKQVIKKF